jgi:WD40 repeat protein
LREPAADELALSALGSMLVSQDLDGLCVWDTGLKSRLVGPPSEKFGYVARMAISLDGTLLAGARLEQRSRIRIWDLPQLRQKSELSIDGSLFNAIGFRSDAHQIVTGERDGTVRIWDVETGELRRILRGYGRKEV